MIEVQKLKERSIRNMGNVQTEVRKRALEFIELAYKQRIPVQISSGFRSMEDQARLYGQGRPNYVWKGEKYGKPGKIVTKAQPGQSNHNKGWAIDYFIVSEDGTKALWKVDEKWRQAASIAKSLGFSWGGDWKSFPDYPHLELRPGTGSVTSSVLRRGMSGPSVKEVQTVLGARGYQLGNTGADGHFGPRTESAVRELQRDWLLQVDGIIGSETSRALDRSSYPGFPLKRGRTGKYVRQIQRALGIDVDGSYGSQTESSVRKFQTKHKLQSDGITGPATWRKLFP
ncbi:peptidoglycan-binding protein [Halobacillus halophilus]|uniref:peptidoglycan-binding protein n=1 Tax=Halobacillus halophilus TaxID=1570 RepID=UPI001CD1F238|nr:peptidoglycan-binding protein [Halobacillus halophilus]MCA1010810.1 peptidoglycan-binding protein [Halobacillus halophilus]